MAAPAAALGALIKWRTIVRLAVAAVGFMVLIAAGLFALMFSVISMATTSAEAERHEQEQAALEGAAGPWGGHDNGSIPTQELCTVPWNEAMLFRCDAASSLSLLNADYRAEFGTDIPIGYAYRPLSVQVSIFLERYDIQPDESNRGPFNDVIEWNGDRYVRMRGAKAAFPGKSNHGWALAFDLSGPAARFDTPENDWLIANSSAYSWIHPSWAKKGGPSPEAWHFEYVGLGLSGGSAVQGEAIVEIAKSAIGTQYVFGGGDFNGPTGGGFDCSGLVSWAVYRASGAVVELPRTAKLQGAAGQKVTEGWGPGIDMSLLRPGDAIAFKTPSNRVGTGLYDFDHIGIYAGQGVIVHSPRPGGHVEMQNLDSSYLKNAFWSVRRFV